MIVPMKKVTVLSLAAHRDETLEALRDLGAIHVSPLQAPSTGDVESARRRLDEARAALATLERTAAAKPISGTTEAEESAAPADLLEEAIRLTARLRDRKDRIQRLDEQLLHLAPLGDFDPAQLRDLLHRGVSIRLFKSEPKSVFMFPPDAVVVELQRDKTVAHFALVNGAGWSDPAAFELPVPERSPADLKHERGQLAAELAEDTGSLVRLAPRKARVELAVNDLENRLRWLETRDGMAAEGPLLLLQGYMPAGDLHRLETAAKARGWGWLAEEPAEADPVPTLIHSPKWIRPIQYLFDILGLLPGYREVDVSPIFLVFFSLFFAMLVGDAVYGLIFLGLTVLIKLKWKSAPRQLVPLLGILSVSTVVWGVLTGSYLGIRTIPGPLKTFQLDWLMDPDNLHIQQFCFFIGAVQMSLAHAWNVWRFRRNLTALSHVGWMCSCWAMFAYANNLVLGQDLLPGAAPLLGTGVVLILFFTVPFRDLRKEFASLLTLPLSIIGNFGDVISYLRLYLVGSASVELIRAFNEMAFSSSGFFYTLLGALLIFGVHILNIMLSSLAVLVHGVRLNALEFSTHMGIQWLGQKYNPFRKRTAP